MKNKLVILLVEGASKKLINKWQDKLPYLSNLLSKNGGTLTTNVVPYEAPNLISAFTGLPPEEHGVYSYWHVHNNDYIPKTWDAPDIKVPMLWQLPEMEQYKFSLLNLFCTFPAYPINGKMISYLQQPSLRGCYPEGYIKELLRNGHKYTSDVFVGLGYGQDKPISGKNISPREEYYRLFEETERARVNIASEMMEESDVLIANFTIIDRLSHFFWHEIEYDSPITEEDSLLFKAYRFIDEVVGQFADKIGTASNLLVFSEIGYGPLINFVSINNYLETGKFLSRENSSTSWQKTLTFESVQGAHGVNINKKDRYLNGLVNDDDYQKVRIDTMDYLKSLINPKTSLPMFRFVKEREEVYNGTYMQQAPDIIVEMADRRFVPLGDEYWSSKVHRINQSGWHRKEGFWTGYGDKFNGKLMDASILDIAPTVFKILDKEINTEFVGKPII